MDSLLINDTSIHLFEEINRLTSTKPWPENYARIRAIATEKVSLPEVKYFHVREVIPTLARYQKQADKKYIASFFNDPDSEAEALYAASEFPDPYFYASVKNTVEREWKRSDPDKYKMQAGIWALTHYPRPETLLLFQKLLATKDEARYRLVGVPLLTAIYLYPNPLFEPLKQQIKLSVDDHAQVDKYLERCD